MANRNPTDMGGAFAGVPLCSRERCPSYDGKRCGETGNEPGEVCVPEVRAQRAEFVHLRSIMKVDRRRLADGVEPMIGQRVAIVPERAKSWGIPAHTEHVHVITNLLGDGGNGCRLVECGPTQFNVGMLRLAPDGAEVTCPNCRNWDEQRAKMRADAEVYRREQIGEIHRIKTDLENANVNAERLRRLIVESCASVGVRDDEDNAYRAVQLLARELAKTQTRLADADRILGMMAKAGIGVRYFCSMCNADFADEDAVRTHQAECAEHPAVKERDKLRRLLTQALACLNDAAVALHGSSLYKASTAAQKAVKGISKESGL